MKLDVKANGELLGWLSLDSDSGLFAFGYAPDWLAKDIRFPLSPAFSRTVPTLSIFYNVDFGGDYTSSIVYYYDCK